MLARLHRKYLDRRFDRIDRALNRISNQETKQMATVQELNAAVADLTVVVDEAVTAISNTSGIKPEELDAAVAGIKENIKKLNDAVHAASM